MNCSNDKFRVFLSDGERARSRVDGGFALRANHHLTLFIMCASTNSLVSYYYALRRQHKWTYHFYDISLKKEISKARTFGSHLGMEAMFVVTQ